MYTIGEMFRKRREEKGLSRWDACDGICSEPTISRFERGEQNPARETIVQLLERVDLPVELAEMYETQYEIKAMELVQEINDAIRYGDTRELQRLLNELQATVANKENYRELVAFVEIVLKQHEGVDIEELYKITYELTNSFMDKFKPSMIKKSLLSRRQISILNLLASYKNKLEKKEEVKTKKEEEIKTEKKEEIKTKEKGKGEGILIWKELVDYIDKRGQYARIADIYAEIVYNLSAGLGFRGRHKECITLANKGIEHCIKYNVFGAFAGLLENKGFGLIALGVAEEGKKLVTEAYVIYHSRGEANKAKKTKELALSMGVDIKKLY